jgi:hypothetical protein
LLGTEAPGEHLKNCAKWRCMILLATVLGSRSTVFGAGENFFPIQDVRPGLRGIGKTVFEGDHIAEFQVEILGVLQDFGPRQPIILARLSGGPLAETGILQGMSGSPVYIDGKLLGAVALGFPFSKEPIAGIQPIESMLSGANFPKAIAANDRPAALSFSLSHTFRSVDSLFQLFSSASPMRNSPFGEISDILTPMSVSGFSSLTVSSLDAVMHRYGFSTEPVGEPTSKPTGKQGVGISTGKSQEQMSKSLAVSSLKPGSMISVGLITGDFVMTADGTVTYIDGNKVYAFGHRFLNIGSSEMPFAYSKVITCIPSVNTSFKLSAPQQWIGTILSDHATGIAGEIGRSAQTIPVQIAVHSGTTGNHDYHLQLVNDRLLTPFLTQTALFSMLDATERTIGTGTLKLQGEVHFDGNLPPLIVNDIYVSDSGLAQQASGDAVVTLAFVLGGGFQDVRVKDMSFRLEEVDRKKQLRLAQAWTSAHEVRPGETVKITAVFQGENGADVVRTVPYTLPVGAALGPLNITLSDANTLNFPDFAGIAQSQFRTAAGMIQAVNRYRDNGALYVRLWRQEPAFSVAGPMPGGELSDPPPSVALVLADTSSSASSGATATTRGSDVAQLTVPMQGYVVTGAKTIQIEVKE